MASFHLHEFELALAERLAAATANGEALCLRGGGTKDFYGNAPRGTVLNLPALFGGSPAELLAAVEYEPSELVVTAPAVLPLEALESLLAAHGQMLAFEPPHYAPGGTVGGCVAAGLAGPRRRSAGPAHGGVRDFVLGARLVDARGRVLGFGGRVMKNVAGYDLSRVLAGSLGVLGAITQVSLKVLPRPLQELTLVQECAAAAGLERVNRWAGQPLPVSATAWEAGCLHVRLSGAGSAVAAAVAKLGGEPMAAAAAEKWWAAVRDHRLPFFQGAETLWRLALPAPAAPLGLDGPQFIEWGGAQRWLRSALPPDAVRSRAAALGGHATAFRAGQLDGTVLGETFPRPAEGVFTPLSAPLLAIHRRLKAEFDPAGVLNPGRLHVEF
ncbi:MAG: glycolate oxidase binding subunit [Pseudomonadota bacterium]